MHSKTKPVPLDRLIEPLTDCLTREAAERYVKMKPDPKLQARVDELADKCSAGTLTEAERDEYGRYVTYGTIFSIIKSKARQFLAESHKR
jgi:hypothetical protein